MCGTGEHRTIACVTVIVLHALAISAFWIGLANSGVRTEPTILEIEVVQADRHPEPLPPLPRPPVNLNQSVVIQIAAPEIVIPAPADPPPLQVEAIQTVITPPQPQAPELAPHPNVKPKAIYVPGGWERYPAESLRARETGAPTITICISATGVADSVQVTKSSGFPRLDQAAVGIGKEARFKPAMQDGKPVPLCLPYRITFATNIF